MKRWMALLLTVVFLCPVLCQAESQDAAYTLDRVVILSRHNIRSPLSGGGSVLARLDCKTDKDWLDFAEHHTWLSETITLSKKLELEHKEIIEVLLESTELRCQDVETKEIGVIVLNKPLKEFFTIRRVTYLGYGEATIDLSGERPIMFVNLDKKNKEG